MAITLVGVGTEGGGTTAITYSPPSGIQTGDLLLLVLETANDTVTAPGAWLDVPSSPQGTGTAGGAAATRLKIMYRWVDGTTITYIVSDPGNHQAGGIVAFRGVDPTNPFNANAGSVKASASTSITFPSVTTTVNNCWVLLAEAHALPDSNTNNQTSNQAMASLGTITELLDYNTASGNGGGFSIAYGVKATAGSTGTGSGTHSTSTVNGVITLALAPAPLVYEIDAQPDTFTLTGADATLSYSRRLSLDAASTSFTLTGADAELTYVPAATAIELDAQPGAFTFTGQAATLAYGHSLNAASSAFTLTGQAATLTRTRVFNAEAGAFALTGQAATLTYGAADAVLNAEAGTFTLTGQSATLSRTYALHASAGAFTDALWADPGYIDPDYAGGTDAVLAYGRQLNTAAGAFTFSGKAATLSKGALLPDPADVKAGVTYGPGGTYVGTLVATGGGMVWLRRR